MQKFGGGFYGGVFKGSKKLVPKGIDTSDNIKVVGFLRSEQKRLELLEGAFS